MSPIQTTYSERMALPTPGTIGGSDFGTKTGVVETAAGIGFGLAVSQGANSDKGVILGGTLAGFLGISVKDVTLVSASSPDEYQQYQTLGYLNRGQIWAEPEAAVAAGDPVNFNGTTGALSNTGGEGPIPGARWVTAAAAGERALVELMAVGA